MRDQLSVPYPQKVDQPLMELYNGPELALSASVPVVIRYAPESRESVVARVQQHGGRVRHVLSVVGAVVAWLPLLSVPELAKLAEVQRIELEQEFTIA